MVLCGIVNFTKATQSFILCLKVGDLVVLALNELYLHPMLLVSELVAEDDLNLVLVGF